MKSQITLTLFASFIAVSMIGCGPQTSVKGDANSSASTGGQNPTQTVPAPPTWDDVNFEGKPTDGSHKNSLVVFVDKTNQTLKFVLPVPITLSFSGEVELTQMPGVKLSTHVDEKGQVWPAVIVPLIYVVRNGVLLPGQRLPNGDTLPDVPAGELPGFGVEIPANSRYKIFLYIGVNVAAVFVELPSFNLPFGLVGRVMFPVENKEKTKRVGTIGYVSPKSGYAGGLYLAAQLPPDVARVIDDLVRW